MQRKITPHDKGPWYIKNIPEKVTSIEQLFGTLPSDVDLDDIKLERLTRLYDEDKHKRKANHEHKKESLRITRAK